MLFLCKTGNKCIYIWGTISITLGTNNVLCKSSRCNFRLSQWECHCLVGKKVIILYTWPVQFSSVAQSCPTLCDLHGLQHARLDKGHPNQSPVLGVIFRDWGTELFPCRQPKEHNWLRCSEDVCRQVLTWLKRGRPNGAAGGEQVNARLSSSIDMLWTLLMLKRDPGGTFTNPNAILLFCHINAVQMRSWAGRVSLAWNIGGK